MSRIPRTSLTESWVTIERDLVLLELVTSCTNQASSAKEPTADKALFQSTKRKKKEGSFQRKKRKRGLFVFSKETLQFRDSSNRGCPTRTPSIPHFSSAKCRQELFRHTYKDTTKTQIAQRLTHDLVHTLYMHTHKTRSKLCAYTHKNTAKMYAWIHTRLSAISTETHTRPFSHISGAMWGVYMCACVCVCVCMCVCVCVCVCICIYIYIYIYIYICVYMYIYIYMNIFIYR